MTAISKRYDFVLLFDVTNGNPNGDPDAANLPRYDPETGLGLVTDVCLKRKVRNYVSLVKNYQAPYDIYIKEKAVLNALHDEAYKTLGIDTGDGKDNKRKGKGDDVNKARHIMCQKYFDVRTFGAVMSTGTNCGQVRGPVQMTFAQSIDPIFMAEHTVTRCAVTTEKDSEDQKGDNRTMGRKYTVPYGLYLAKGFISPHLANQTGFSDEDLALLWKALACMFEHDRAAARGEMITRGLYVFEHESELGSAPVHRLFDRITIKRTDDAKPARHFSDYTVDVKTANLPDGITLHSLDENGVLQRVSA